MHISNMVRAAAVAIALVTIAHGNARCQPVSSGINPGDYDVLRGIDRICIGVDNADFPTPTSTLIGWTTKMTEDVVRKELETSDLKIVDKYTPNVPMLHIYSGVTYVHGQDFEGASPPGQPAPVKEYVTKDLTGLTLVRLTEQVGLNRAEGAVSTYADTWTAIRSEIGFSGKTRTADIRKALEDQLRQRIREFARLHHIARVTGRAATLWPGTLLDMAGPSDIERVLTSIVIADRSLHFGNVTPEVRKYIYSCADKANSSSGNVTDAARQAIVSALTQVDDLKAASRVTDSIQDSKARASALGFLAAAYKRRGYLDEPKQLLKSAGKEALLQSACQAFFDAMIATTRDPYGYPRLDISIADTLVELHCDSLLLLGIVAETASDYRFDAETVAARIPDPLMRDHAYEIIIADQCQKEHEYLFVQDLVNKIKDGDTRGKALSELAEAFARDGDITEAIKARNKIPTDYWKMLTDSKLAPIQAKSGDVSGAIQRAMNISSDTPAATQTWKSVALESVVRAVADKGNYAIALETAGKLKGALSKDQALIIVLKAQAKKGDTAAATKTCGLLVDPTYKASGDVEIARALCRAGNRAEGLKVAASVATRIEQIKSESDRKDALSSLAVIQASAGDSAGALAVVGQIQDDNDRWNATIKVLDAAMAQRDRAGADAAIKQLEALAATEQPGRYYRRAEVASRKLELGETTSASSTIAAIANRDDRIAASSAAIMYTLKRAAEGSKLTGK